MDFRNGYVKANLTMFLLLFCSEIFVIFVKSKSINANAVLFLYCFLNFILQIEVLAKNFAILDNRHICVSHCFQLIQNYLFNVNFVFKVLFLFLIQFLSLLLLLLH